MSVNIQFKRGTKSAIDGLASQGGLLQGEPLYFTDLKTVGIATSTTAYEILGVNPVILFTAYLSAAQAPGANQPLTNWSILTNVGGGSYSNGGYTIPKTGWYNLSIEMLSNLNGGGGLLFRINSTNRLRVAYASSAGTAYYSGAGSEFVYLTKNDVVKVISIDNLDWYGNSTEPVGRWNIEFKGL